MTQNTLRVLEDTNKEIINYFAYMRISTKEERGLQKFTRQENKIKNWEKENNIKFVFIGQDDASGKNFNREDWKRIEKLAKEKDCIVFSDIGRFTRGDTEKGYEKYMELFYKGIELEFIDNPTVNTKNIKSLLQIADNQNILSKVLVESIVKILIIAELNKVEEERLSIIKKITDGINASDKKSGRPVGKLDKMNDELKEDIIKFINDRSIKQVDLMKKHNISRNTLKKYVEIVKEETAEQ